VKRTLLKEIDAYLYAKVVTRLTGINVGLNVESPLTHNGSRVELGLGYEIVTRHRRRYQRERAENTKLTLVLIYTDRAIKIAATYDDTKKNTTVYPVAFDGLDNGNVLLKTMLKSLPNARTSDDYPAFKEFSDKYGARSELTPVGVCY
jgi:hypothetical protein